jgi:PAS domain S-box-containing protein
VETERTNLAVILARLSTGVMSLQADFTIRTLNQAAAGILGADLERAVGKPLAEAAVGQPLFEQFLLAIRAHLDTGEAEWREQITLRSDSSRRVLMCACTTLTEAPDSESGYVIVFDDITALLQAQRDAAWGEVARRLAHEIKNPLTPIQLNAEHLRRVNADRGEPLSPVLNDCVSTILEQVRLLRRIASEFSNFASSPTAKPSKVYVQDLLRDALDPYRTGVAGRVRFEEDIPHDLPPVFVDRTLIARSLTNLIENALHAMPSGGTFTVVAAAVDSAVRIRLTDTGVGMDAEALARAFEPYFSTKTSGTGLGLPIAKRNIELSGGAIAVTSMRDQGTTVEVTLPEAGL